jgi:signal peptide peptidase SppA
MNYPYALASFHNTLWAIRESTLEAMQSLLLQRSEGTRWSSEEIRDRILESNIANGYMPIARDGARFLGSENSGGILMEGPNGQRNSAAPGSVGVIPMVGIISNRMSMISNVSGPGAGASIQKMTAQFRQALDDDQCKAVIFDCDSPGGAVDGVQEFASEIFSARGYKPIIAVVNSMACSAAYWLASAASTLVITPSGTAGSIGVYMTHFDESEALKQAGIKVTFIKAGKYKVEGNSAEPLPGEARAALQSKVDDYYGSFLRAVAQNRGTSQTAVRDGYGQGRSVLANDALQQGLVDRVGTLDNVLAGLGVRIGGKRGGAKSENGRRLSATNHQLELEMMRAGATPSTQGDRLSLRRHQLALMHAGGAANVPGESVASMRERWEWLRREQLEAMKHHTSIFPGQ